MKSYGQFPVWQRAGTKLISTLCYRMIFGAKHFEPSAVIPAQENLYAL